MRSLNFFKYTKHRKENAIINPIMILIIFSLISNSMDLIILFLHFALNPHM
jgi:hypothetical protein